MSFLHYMVIQLQRCFRGYYSRKYKQDHARRKQYCRMIEEKGRLVLEGMERYLMEQTEVRMSCRCVVRELTWLTRVMVV